MKYILLLLSFLFFSVTAAAADNTKAVEDKKVIDTTINAKAAKEAKTFDPINSDIDSADSTEGCGGKPKPDLPLGCNNADISCVCNADVCDWIVSCN